MASPNLVNSLAKELLEDDNLEEAEKFLTARLEEHMKAGRTDRVVAVAAIVTKVRAAIANVEKEVA